MRGGALLIALGFAAGLGFDADTLAQRAAACVVALACAAAYLASDWRTTS